MSMTKCGECGADVSDKAPACPHCGAPPSKPFWSQNIGCGSVIVLGLVLWLAWSALTPSKPQVDPEVVACTPPSAEMQEMRDALIQKMIQMGGVHKIEPSAKGIMRVFVTPAFYAADVDTKRDLISVIWARYFECVNPSGLVLLKDSRSGRTVGRFSMITGFEMDE